MWVWLDFTEWPWQLLVLVKIAAGSFLAPFVYRLLGGAPARERARRILLQYGWAVFFAFVIALLIWGRVPYSVATWGILFVGVLQPFGGFFYWRASAWSLSRVPIFMALTSIIPLFLSAALLGEWRVLLGNTLLLTGFGVAVMGVVLHFRHDAQVKREKDKTEKVPLLFYGYALIFTIVFGVGMFGWNYWAKGGVPASELMMFWYSGALCGAVVFFLLLCILGVKDPKNTEEQPPPAKVHTLIAIGALSIVLNLMFGFLALQKVEQVVVLPFFALGDIIGPVLIGMFIFHEWKQVRGIGWLYLGLGHAGAAVIAFAR